MEAERAVRGRRDGDPAGAARKARELDLVEGEVPRRLRAEREKRGMSVRELARRLDLTPSAISQIETGRARPSVSTLYSIVTELGLSLDGLFNQGATQPPPTAAPQASSVS